MSNPTHKANGDNKGPTKLNLTVPSSVDLTTTQIQQVLQVAHGVAPFLIMSRPGNENLEVPDQDVRTSAAATFIRACNVLDNILDDATRWGREKSDALDETLSQLNKAHADLADEHRRLAHVSARPSVLLHPAFHQLPDGRWLCLHGADSSLVGIGMSPNEAMDDFDRVFFESNPAGINASATQDQPQATLPGSKPKTKRKNAKRTKMDE